MRAVLFAVMVVGLAWSPPRAPAQPPPDPDAAEAEKAAQPIARRPPASVQPIATRQQAFSIPFVVNEQGAPLLEVQLFVSSDHGATWQLYARRHPSAKEFSFQADHDGEYWFAIRTIDREDHPRPAGGLQAELKVLIDTEPPELQFSATVGPAGEVIASWLAADENLAPDTLKIEYQPAVGTRTSPPDWRRVAVELPRDRAVRTILTGQSSWWPDTAAPLLKIRATVQDRAGNTAEVNRRVATRPVAPSIPAGAPLGRALTEAAARSTSAFPPARDPFDRRRLGSSAAAHGAAEHPRPSWAVSGQQAASFAGPPPAEQTTRPAGSWTDMIPAREHLSVTNARRISLQYDVQSVGPSGVAKVELWATRDGGRTWESWGTDPDARSPVLVEVDEQGVYGFRVVITNGLGLSSPPPSAGDPADIWIAVDVTKPVVRIRSASLGTGDDAGKLVIRWTAEDPHLAARPVTLLVSNRPDGPWTTIAVGLPDSGQYRWAIDPSTPRPIYLRLEARDAAGNAGVDQTAQPIQLEGLTPQGRIRSFAPAPAEQGSERNGTVVAGKRR